MTRLTSPLADNRFVRLLAVMMLAWLAATGGAIATAPDADAKPVIYHPNPCQGGCH